MATKLKTGNIAADQLESLLQRIERLEEEKKALADDIKEVYAEAKAHGYNTKIMRQIVKLRAMDAAERAEQEALLDTYKHALGMLSDTPLDNAAVDQAREDAQTAKRMAKAAANSPRVEMMVRMADEAGVSPEVKDLAVRTARLSETNPLGANAIIATVKALAAEGRGAIEQAAKQGGGVAFPPHDPETGEVLDDEDDEPAATTKAEPAEMHAGTDYDFPDCLKRC